MFSVESSGFNSAVKINDEIKHDIDEINKTELLKIADKIIYEARNTIQQNQNINRGDLLSSVKILEEDLKSVTIGSDVFWSWFIEYGRGPVIATDKTLHWIDKTTGKDVFSRYSKATEPQPFLEPNVILESKKLLFVYPEKINNVIESKKTGGSD